MSTVAVERPSCPRPNPWTGSSCKSRGCPVCGGPWAKRWETITMANLHAYDGPVALVSVTAPGSDVLPWACKRRHVHSGPRGCRVDEFEADAWCETLQARYRKLRDAARVATLRALGTAPTLLERVWEPQKRGVPHVHIVVGMRTDEERAAANRFAAELARLAPDHGFGHVDRGKRTGPRGARELPVVSPGKAARYLSGYLLGRSKKKGTIRDNIADPRMPRSLIWLTPALSSLSDSPRIAAMRERLRVEAGTGVTMRRLRYAMWVYGVLSGRLDTMPVLYGEDLWQLAGVLVYLDSLRPRAPAEGEQPRDLDAYARALKAMRKRAQERNPERFLTTLSGRQYGAGAMRSTPTVSRCERCDAVVHVSMIEPKPLRGLLCGECSPEAGTTIPLAGDSSLAWSAG